MNKLLISNFPWNNPMITKDIPIGYAFTYDLPNQVHIKFTSLYFAQHKRKNISNISEYLNHTAWHSAKLPGSYSNILLVVIEQF
jgi:hypothetical protein